MEGNNAVGPDASVAAETVRFEGDLMWVGLSNGRVIGVPLVWSPPRKRVDESPKGT